MSRQAQRRHTKGRFGLCAGGIALGSAALVLITFIAAAVLVPRARADDLLQQAFNYVLTGKVDPADVPEIVDRKACVVVMQDPTFRRYRRFYFGRFKLDAARFNKRYSGPRVTYDLDVQGDDIILEYLSPDKTTVLQAYKSAQIPLPGELDPTQRALKIISDACKTEGPKAPF